MPERSGPAAALVASGIFLSRLAGLVRQRVLAHYLGLGDAADALAASFRIPNLLQNLFGEGVLSASFIPVYARLVSEGRRNEARRVAAAVGALLAAAMAVAVALGVAFSAALVDALMPGFSGAKRELTITLVRLIFPGTGLLVMSAWCLGILNSHGRFFLSYAAPVAWNAAIIAAAIAAGARQAPDRLAVWVAWGAVAGGLLQVLVQLPQVLALGGGFTASVAGAGRSVAPIVRNFIPAVLGRGVNQISAWVDGMIVSLLGTGAQAALANAQLLYTLPVSLFGMSVSASELPVMSAVGGEDAERSAALRGRFERGAGRIAFFVVPCAIAFVSLGGLIAAAVFQTGAFGVHDSRFVWAILAGSSVGLLPATLGRLAASACYALGDARTPLRTAAVRVAVSGALGYVAATRGPGWLGIGLGWGAALLTAVSGAAAWLEFGLLVRALRRRVGEARVAWRHLGLLTATALAGSAAGWLVWKPLEFVHPALSAAVALAAFAAVYGVLTFVAGVEDARAIAARIRRD